MESLENVTPLLVGLGGVVLPIIGSYAHALLERQTLQDIIEISEEDRTPERFSSLTKRHLFQPLLAYTGLNLFAAGTALVTASMVRSQEMVVDDGVLGLGIGFAIVAGHLIKRLNSIRSRVKLNH